MYELPDKMIDAMTRLTEAEKEKIKHDSHKYAKKQYVFMKGICNAKIYNIPKEVDYTEEIISDLKTFLRKYDFML